MSTVATTAAILPSFAFFCALPYLPLTYTLAILSIMYYRSFRLGSRARRQPLLQCEKKQRQQAGKKYWRTPSGRKEIIDKYPLL